MVLPREHNIGLDVAEHLLEVYGFVPAAQKWAGLFHREIDAQHTVSVNLSPFQTRPPGGGSQVSVDFWVSRLDVMSLQKQVFDNVVMPRWWTIMEGFRFFDQPPGIWSFMSVAEDRAPMFAWLDVWVPRLVEEGPSLPFIESNFERYRVAAGPDGYGWSPQFGDRWVCNQMLWGWSDDAERELLGPFEELIASTDRESIQHATYTAQLERIRRWVDQHPDGIERELID
ncbi:MAG: hypothetical protein AAF567_15590 [Actinomycetota bacterium]